MTKYPTDRRGIPIPAYEAGIPYIECEKENVHHQNFYRRAFGATAISQTFRDLERFQEILPVDSHQLLHKRYSGIALPDFSVMLDEIYAAKAEGEKMKIFDQSIRQYVYYDIDDDYISMLDQQYNELSDDMKPIFI